MVSQKVRFLVTTRSALWGEQLEDVRRCVPLGPVLLMLVQKRGVSGSRPGQDDLRQQMRAVTLGQAAEKRFGPCSRGGVWPWARQLRT
jgi:hypothetical protein